MLQAHRNNIGLLRLVLASCVIVGHAPEMIDGDRHREPLTMLFHSISLGGFAVDGFFLLSGYLITKSMLSTGAVVPYMVRRLLRIWPGYALAFLLSVFCLAPIVGAAPWRELLRTAASFAAMREPPIYPGQFAGLAYPALNGSMWTIAYELRCYILVALIFGLGLLHRRRVCAALTAALLVVSIPAGLPGIARRLDAIHPLHSNFWLGDLSQTIHLTAIFLVGMCAYLFWDVVLPRLRTERVAVCALIAIGLLFIPSLAEFGLSTFGAVVLFWIAFVARLGVVQRINDRWDISYGVYLYGWPVAITILYFNRGVSPELLVAASLPLSWACGAISWWGLERWARNLWPSLRRRPADAGPMAAATSAAAA